MMAAMPVYGKIPLKILFPGTRGMFIGPMVLWLLYARCESVVNFVWRCFRDDEIQLQNLLGPHYMTEHYIV